MKIINFDITDFENSKNKKWILGNDILYKFCSDHPQHTDPEEIRAKIWLIGRAYAAAIERRKKHLEMKGDKFYDYVVKEFIQFNDKENFDERLKQLKNKDFNKENLTEILSIHGILTKFFKELTGQEKRSLASKCLHFHFNIFPIYDSRASTSINHIIKGKEPEVFGDKQYSNFCNKILLLYNFIKKQTGKTPTLREIDIYLVDIANNKIK